VHAYHQYPQAWLAARRHRARLVYDAHDFYPQFLEGGEGTALERRAMRGFYLVVEWACARSADAVLTVSDGVADLMAARNGRRPVIVRNCAELRGLRDDGPDVRSAAGVAPEEFLVVMPGNHKAGMRADEEAIDAFAALPERAHLVFVGDGYDAIRAQVAQRGLEARVHFLGAVAAGEVPAFIRSADAVAVLYLPTMGAIEFALPNGFFAGIAAALPILWPARLPEIRRLAEEHGFGVEIEPEDPASIAAGVRALLEDPQRLAALRERSRQAREMFSWEAEERRLLELVDGLTGGRR
jgi:glycosyltransferase involved in cell wall biosynthesis